MRILTPARGLCAVLALILIPSVAIAQYYGPEYGPYGPGPYAYGPPDGPGPGPGYYRRGGRAYRGGRGGTVSYGGFRIANPGDPDQLDAVQHQIDIVNNAGLSRSSLKMFHGQPIKFGGRSHSEGREVVLGNLQGKGARPVLLHEFMHVYHRHLPGGNRNPTILRYYNEAVYNGLYQPGSYMMKNPGEFFAMTASAYLNGTVGRPPYNREAIAQQQPGYYAYLAKLFGPR